MNENTKITLFDLEKQKILEESGVIEFKNRLSLEIGRASCRERV